MSEAAAAKLVRVVLIAGGHGASRMRRARQAKRLGYEVVEAETGGECLRLARERRPDLILLEASFPDMDGADVCRRLKADDSAAPVPVIRISTEPVVDDPATARPDSADAELAAPVNPRVLRAVIEALLRVRRAELSLWASMERERKAREDADRANGAKDEFLATLSHELRTPLSAMVGWIWQLRHGTADESIRQRALEGLERSTNVQVRMINDLLDVSLIGRGALDLNLAPAALDAVVNSALESIHGSLENKQLALTVAVSPVAIMGDAKRLEQIVGNLLRNAVKFSRPNGHIDVSLKADDEAAVIRVKDTGIGIDAPVLPHIFDEFRQGETGPTKRRPGLGLGLAIVRHVVMLHGGTVIAESEGPGLGATFTVRLPLAETSHGDAPAAGASAIGHPLRGTRLLVVDDDADIRAWLKNIIEFGGGSVVTADSVKAALDLLGRGPFDVVVSDIGMPEQDGLMLLETLRARGFVMPAVAVTAFSSADDRRRILAAGYNAYFSKPVEPSAFIAELVKLHAAKQAAPAPERGE